MFIYLFPMRISAGVKVTRVVKSIITQHALLRNNSFASVLRYASTYCFFLLWSNIAWVLYFKLNLCLLVSYSFSLCPRYITFVLCGSVIFWLEFAYIHASPLCLYLGMISWVIIAYIAALSYRHLTYIWSHYWHIAITKNKNKKILFNVGITIKINITTKYYISRKMTMRWMYIQRSDTTLYIMTNISIMIGIKNMTCIQTYKINLA